MARPQGQGFYNPNMPGPDWSQGISGIINQIVAQKQYMEDEARKESRFQQEMGFKERQLGVQEDYWTGTIEAREEAARLAAGKPSSFQEKVNAGIAIGLTRKESTTAALNISPPKTVPKNVTPGFDLYMKDQFGEDWREKVDENYDQYARHWVRFRAISEKTEKDEGKEVGTITRQGIRTTITGIDNLLEVAMNPLYGGKENVPIAKALRERRKDLSKYLFKPRFEAEDLKAIEALSDLESVFGEREETTTKKIFTNEEMKKK